MEMTINFKMTDEEYAKFIDVLKDMAVKTLVDKIEQAVTTDYGLTLPKDLDAPCEKPLDEEDNEFMEIAAVKEEILIDDELPEEIEEEVEKPAPKKSKAKAKKITIDDVNDACKNRAREGGKNGVKEVKAILLKKFKTDSLTKIKEEDYAAVLESMKV